MNVIRTSTEKYEETRMDYFREDFGLNSCYFNWHIIHPFEAIDKKIVALDRRGELWCYFHQQIIAHYNNERYCNDLLHVKPLYDLFAEIPEGYFSKICTQYTSNSWPPRQEDCTLQDLYRPKEWLSLDRSQFQRWIDRICNAIDSGEVLSVCILVFGSSMWK